MDKRPVNLNLMTIRFPCTAVVSILHRITGVLIFLSLPVLLCVLQQSIASGESFDHLKALLTLPLHKLEVWVILSTFLYHVLAGIRHLMMDIGVGEALEEARSSAVLVLILTVVLMCGLGLLLW